MKNASSVVSTLERALSRDKVTIDPELLGRFSRDSWVSSQLSEVEGKPLAQPMCVVRPVTTADVVSTVDICREAGVALVPFGLGSGVCGGVLPGAAAVVLDAGSMRRVRTLEPNDLLATFEAGVRGADAEAAAAQHGLTLGHFPQSMNISSVGGWVATRSSGQCSTKYGNIEQLVLGLEVVLPNGKVLQTPLTPRSSLGPDLGQLFVGSEGTLGVLTAVTLSLRRAAAARRLCAYFLPSMERGFDLLRTTIQGHCTPTIMRLYDLAEVARVFPDCDGRVLMIDAHEGAEATVHLEHQECQAVAHRLGAEAAPIAVTERWLERRFHTPSFREILDRNIVFDTIEVSALWSRIDEVYRSVIAALRGVRQIVTASAHCSHVYRSGANLYFTFAARGASPEEMRSLYRECWQRTIEATLHAGGTIAHHHGVGRVRSEWLRAQLGATGLEVLGSLKRSIDPAGIMNPGVLLPSE